MSPPLNAPYDIDGPVMPVLVSDTLVTFRDVVGRADLIPATFRAESLLQPSSVALARKLNIYKNFAWACAGDGATIRKLRYELIRQADEWDNLDRPMRRLGDVSNALGCVQTIGVHVKQDRINFVTPRQKERLPYLGIVGAAGSGGDSLIEQCKDGCQQFELNPAFRDGNVFSRTAGLVAWLNGRRLCQEMVGANIDSWGGYLEWAYNINGNWERGPKSINMFYFCQVINDKINFRLLRRQVLYEPGEKQGYILSVSPLGSSVFVLDDLRQKWEGGEEPMAHNWIDWKPEWVTLNFIIDYGNNKMKFSSRSLDQLELESFELTIKDDSVKLRLEEVLLHGLFSELAAAQGCVVDTE